MLWVYNVSKEMNPLTGQPYAEFCTKNKLKHRGNMDDPAKVAGNGVFGFRARRLAEPIEITTVGGESYAKHRYKTVCRKRKTVCRLATTFECHRPDRLIENERKAQKKAGRKRFRARKGQRPF